MIKSFAHKALENFFLTGSKVDIHPSHAKKLARQLSILNVATSVQDMDMPGWRLRQRSTGHRSVWVKDNWRLTFCFEGEDAEIVNYQEDHSEGFENEPHA